MTSHEDAAAGASGPVVALVGSLFGDGWGSAAGYSQAGASFQRRLVAALSRNGFEVDRIFSVPPTSFFPRGPLFRGGRTYADDEKRVIVDLPFVNTGPLQVLSLGIGILPRLFAWAWKNRRRPRFIVQYNTFPTPGLVVASVARVMKCRSAAVVADVHVPGGGSRPDSFLHRIDFGLQRRTLPRFDGLIVLTSEIAADLAPRTPSILMDGAISDERLLRIPPLSPSSSRKERVIMYSGQISRMKGVDLLLDAFAAVDDEDLRLWITGKGDREDAVRRACAADSRIDYKGYLDYDDVLSLYESADILVNPHTTDLASSRYMFPSKLIDYLATGRPVISTRCAGVETSFSGVLLAACDGTPSSLADAIGAASRRPREDLLDAGRRARELVKETRTWAAQGRRLASFLAALAGEGDASR